MSYILYSLDFNKLEINIKVLLLNHNAVLLLLKGK